MTAIKICGLNSDDAIAAAAGAAYNGFVFFPQSPRHLSVEALAALTRKVGPSAQTVLVTVDADDALLSALLAAARIDILQVHGTETPARVAALKSQFQRPVWVARGIADQRDIEATRAYGEVADLLLFDAKPPKPSPQEKAVLPGGNGLRFDWRLLRGCSMRCAWGLSGGLDADSVAEAIASVRPSMVDVSSGVEDAPGVKSPAKIRNFIAAVQNA